jgi:hypothetical protein
MGIPFIQYNIAPEQLAEFTMPDSGAGRHQIRHPAILWRTLHQSANLIIGKGPTLQRTDRLVNLPNRLERVECKASLSNHPIQENTGIAQIMVRSPWRQILNS